MIISNSVSCPFQEQFTWRQYLQHLRAAILGIQDQVLSTLMGKS